MRAQSVVGVRFERGGDVAYFDASGFDLSQGDMVAVETDDGLRGIGVGGGGSNAVSRMFRERMTGIDLLEVRFGLADFRRGDLLRP